MNHFGSVSESLGQLAAASEPLEPYTGNVSESTSIRTNQRSNNTIIVLSSQKEEFVDNVQIHLSIIIGRHNQ